MELSLGQYIIWNHGPFWEFIKAKKQKCKKKPRGHLNLTGFSEDSVGTLKEKKMFVHQAADGVKQ